MSFIVKFYNVAKRKNSTYKPDESTQSRNFDCSIKENTSIINPVLIIQYNDMTATPFNLNYCYIPSFKRYYWVKNWRNDNALWYAELKVDVLSTYIETIENYSYYIVRSSTLSNGSIRDNLYPMYPRITRKIQNAGYFWQLDQTFDKVGSYVVGIINKTGISNFYKFSPTQFQKFANAVFSDIKWMDFGTDISDGIAKMVMNPAQYITSVRWYPFSVSGGTDMQGVTIGWWGLKLPTGLTKLESKYYETFTADVVPVSHPQISRGNFLNSQPYRSIRLYTPAFGFMEIDGSKVREGETVHNTIYVDFRTGFSQWIASVNIGDVSEILGTVYGKVGFDVAVSDIKTDYASSLSNALGAISSGLSGNFIGAGVGIGNAITQTLSPEITTKGTQGSTIGQTSPLRCYVDCHEIADEDKADNGRPLCTNNNFKTLGKGYYVVENGSTPLMGAFDSEIDEVKNFLEGGVYYA